MRRSHALSWRYAVAGKPAGAGVRATRAGTSRRPAPSVRRSIARSKFAIAAWLSLLLSARAVEAQTTTFSDLRQIVERQTLRVAMLSQDIPPFLVTGDDGQPGGVDVLIAERLAARLGVEPEFTRTAKTTDELIRQVAAGSADIGLSFVSRTISRSMLVRFSRPYVKEHIAFALNRRVALQSGEDCPRSPDDLASLARHEWKIGAQRGTIFESALRDRDLQESMSLFDSIQEMLAAVESGTHMGALAGEVALRHAMNTNPGLRIKIELCLVGEQLDYISVAIRPDAPNLKEFIDVAFENVDLQLDVTGNIEIDADWRL